MTIIRKQHSFAQMLPASSLSCREAANRASNYASTSFLRSWSLIWLFGARILKSRWWGDMSHMFSCWYSPILCLLSLGVAIAKSSLMVTAQTAQCLGFELMYCISSSILVKSLCTIVLVTCGGSCSCCCWSESCWASMLFSSPASAIPMGTTTHAVRGTSLLVVLSIVFFSAPPAHSNQQVF